MMMIVIAIMIIIFMGIRMIIIIIMVVIMSTGSEFVPKANYYFRHHGYLQLMCLFV